jgi:hypothetical protein
MVPAVSSRAMAFDQPTIAELPGGGLRITVARARPGGTKEPARIITMAWGDRYVADLLAVTLPALLAPGNLPAFAEQFDCELVIVTETRLFDQIAQTPVSFELLRHCDLRLVPIDDLLSNWYGITLTYALVRGFSDLGPAMVDTHLVFFNADFIVADGSYRKLAEVIRRGERLVCSPSYCMILEETIDQLRARYNEDTCSLTISRRDMAEMIIAHRHNTIRAKTVNQQLFRIHRYDQYYWYVNDQVLLGRQMPIAVVYMRPEHVLTEMPTFWDYGVISEYCPTTRPCILGDSDEFLMGELRTEGTFGELLHLGWPTVDEIAADLSSFTTQDHRDYGRFTLVLHSADLPDDIDAQAEKLEDFTNAIYRRLSPAISYRNHPFWASAYPRFKERHLAESEKARVRERIKSRFLEQPDGAALRQKISRFIGQMYELRSQQRALSESSVNERRILDTKLKRAEIQYLRSRDALEGDYHRERAAVVSEIDASLALRQRQLARIQQEIEVTQSALVEVTAQQRHAIERRYLEAGLGPSSSLVEPIAVASQRTMWDRVLLRLTLMYHRFFGLIPQTTRWHPYHAMLRHVVAAIDMRRRDRDVLLISSGGPFGSVLIRLMRGRKVTISPGMMLTAAYRDLLGDEAKFDLCVCDLELEDLLCFRTMFDTVRPLMRRSGKVVIFHHNAYERTLDAWVQPFAKRLFPLVGQSKISFGGSRLGAFVVRRFSRAVRRYSPNRFSGLMRLAMLLAMCGPLARIACLVEAKRNPHAYPAHCTSLTIEIELP